MKLTNLAITVLRQISLPAWFVLLVGCIVPGGVAASTADCPAGGTP